MRVGPAILAAVAAAASCATGGPPSNLPDLPGRDAWIASRCWTCHRPGGEGPDFAVAGAQLSDGFHRLVAVRPDLACHEGMFEPIREPGPLVAWLAALRDRRPPDPASHPRVVLPRPVPDPELGRDLFLTHCATCHGDAGAGDGPAGDFFRDDGAPRDFRRGLYRTRSTPTLPTDEDLFASITRGMPGSGMPPFRDLDADARWLLVDHIKSLARAGGVNPFDREERRPVEIADPTAATPERLEAGRKLAERADCRTCHGDDWRGRTREDGNFEWTDEAGRPVRRATDLVRGVFKSGSDPTDLYRTLFLGRGGSPMASYASVFPSEEERWNVVHFVRSLAAPR